MANPNLPTIGLSGYFGYQNLGDEWFVWTWQDLFRGVANIHVIHPLEEVSHLDGVIIGGGDIIMPGFVNNAYFRQELFAKPCWVYGAGIPNDIGWNDASIRDYKELFKKAEGVYLRDPVSVSICKSRLGIDAVEVVDIAWGGPLPDCGKYLRADFAYGNPTTKHVYTWMGLSIRPESFVVGQFMHFVDLVNIAYRSMGLRTMCIPLHPTDMADLGDCRLHELLVTAVNTSGRRLECAPDYIHIYPQNAYLQQRMGGISRCDVYVTTRYHGAIAALRYRVPPVVFADAASNKFSTLNHFIKSTTGVSVFTDNAADLGNHVVSTIHNKMFPEKAIYQLETRARQELSRFRDVVLQRLKR